MTCDDLRQLFFRQFNLRLAPEMCDYVLRQLDNRRAEGLAVIGSDARTGVPLRRVIPWPELDAALAPAVAR